MPTPPLSPEKMQEALDASVRYANATEAAAALGLARGTYQSRLERAQAWKAAQSSVVSTAALSESADVAWNMLDAFIGRSFRALETPPDRPTSDRTRICIAGDFHAPFHLTELVAQMIARESSATDLLIVNGDIQDFYSISRFIKYERVPIEDELAAVDALLGQLSRHFRDVLLVTGNHDRPRFEKQLRSLVSPEMAAVIQYLGGGTLDVLRVMAKRYQNVRFADHLAESRFPVPWLAQVGDLIVTHAEKFSRVPSAALRGIDEWLDDRRDVLSLKPWRVLVQAHTHQLGVIPWHADRLLVEGGCMCQTHGYQLDARVAGRPQRRGYVTLEQVNGVTDLNSVTPYWWDVDANRMSA